MASTGKTRVKAKARAGAQRDTQQKPVGTVLKGLDDPILLIDGTPVFVPETNIIGGDVYETDDDGERKKCTGEKELSRRWAILLGLSCNSPIQPGKTADPVELLRAGHFQRVFWDAKQVELDSGDVEFIKGLLLIRWGGPVYVALCEYLEGVAPVVARSRTEAPGKL